MIEVVEFLIIFAGIFIYVHWFWPKRSKEYTSDVDVRVHKCILLGDVCGGAS